MPVDPTNTCLVYSCDEHAYSGDPGPAAQARTRLLAGGTAPAVGACRAREGRAAPLPAPAARLRRSGAAGPRLRSRHAAAGGLLEGPGLRTGPGALGLNG